MYFLGFFRSGRNENSTGDESPLLETLTEVEKVLVLTHRFRGSHDSYKRPSRSILRILVEESQALEWRIQRCSLILKLSYNVNNDIIYNHLN